MLENKKSSLVMCLEQTLSKNHFPYSFDSYTHKNQAKAFGTHTFLGPLWLVVVSFETQVIL